MKLWVKHLCALWFVKDKQPSPVKASFRPLLEPLEARETCNSLFNPLFGTAFLSLEQPNVPQSILQTDNAPPPATSSSPLRIAAAGMGSGEKPPPVDRRPHLRSRRRRGLHLDHRPQRRSVRLRAEQRRGFFRRQRRGRRWRRHKRGRWRGGCHRTEPSGGERRNVVAQRACRQSEPAADHGRTAAGQSLPPGMAGNHRRRPVAQRFRPQSLHMRSGARARALRRRSS